MRFTYSWLLEHLETKASLEEILDKLTSLGLVVDKVENKAEMLAPFTICEIVEIEKHPAADRLQVCRVNTGSEVLQVVCGGVNARKGLKTVLARAGDVIPSTKQVIKVGKVRGVESFGMLCAGEELLIEEESRGILEVSPDAPVGESYAKWRGLDEIIIEIEVTPNRGDCLGVYGVARDLAATGIGSLKPLHEKSVKGAFPCPISLSVNPEASPYFTGRVIRGVKNGPSPDWLQQKLLSVGLRPISLLVDITNYFTYDRGRPLHVFDVDKLKGDLKVSLSKGGESFEALDGNTYTLTDDIAVIEDDSGVISLGGIMGGESTSCDEKTQNVFLESAFFDPVRTTIAGRNLGIISDSRFRFERGVDPATTLPGLEAATQMILDLCGGEASEVVTGGSEPDITKKIQFDPKKIKSLGGYSISSKDVKSILEGLGFTVQEDSDNFEVTTPSWRSDIENEADLVEEILRIEGYDKIPSIPYGERPESKPLVPLQERRFVIRDLLASRGLVEAITWSFMGKETAELFTEVPETLTLLNPISLDLEVMRPSLLPNLLKAALANQNRGSESVGLFEVGPQYSSPAPEGQDMIAAVVRAGSNHSGNWLEKKRDVDLYDAKGDALSILGVTNIKPQLDQTAPGWYHPGRSATLKLGSKVIGYFGELHPRIVKVFGMKGLVVGCEVFIDRLPLAKRKGPKTPLKLSPYQAVERDFAFVVDEDVTSETLFKSAKIADPELIEEISLFDVFPMEENKKSLALRVRLQPRIKTLTEEEIQAFSQKLIKSVTQATKGILRQ